LGWFGAGEFVALLANNDSWRLRNFPRLSILMAAIRGVVCDFWCNTAIDKGEEADYV